MLLTCHPHHSLAFLIMSGRTFNISPINIARAPMIKKMLTNIAYGIEKTCA